MPGAAGAYADSDSRIYLNQDWLNEADENAVIEVLTEEFGHHLDNLYNRRDTRGDEGKHFLHLIEHGLGPGFDHQNDQPGIDNDDHGVLISNGIELDVEFSRTYTSTKTEYHEAVRFDGAWPTGYLISAGGNSGGQASDWSPLSRYISYNLRNNVTSGKTAKKGQPWASTIVFRRNTPVHDVSQIIWQVGKISGSKDRTVLYLANDGTLNFKVGDMSGNNLHFQSTDPIAVDEWTGLYIDYNGGRTNDEDVNKGRYRIKSVSLIDGSSQDINGTWTANGDGSTGIIEGHLYLGASQWGGTGLSADIASLVLTTLRINVQLPDAEEIAT